MEFKVSGCMTIEVSKKRVKQLIEELKKKDEDELRRDSAYFSEFDEIGDEDLRQYAIIEAVGCAMFDKYHLDWDVDTEGYENCLFYNEDLRSYCGHVTDYDILNEDDKNITVEVILEITSPFYAIYHPKEFGKLLTDMDHCRRLVNLLRRSKLNFG